MFRKRLMMILGIMTVMVMAISACAPAPEPAEINEPAPQEEITEEETSAEENTNDDSDSGNTDSSPDAAIEDDGTEASEGSGADTPSDAEMEALIAEKAGSQHTLDFILGQNKTYDEWVRTLDRMIGYGADINEEEKELIIQWLINR